MLALDTMVRENLFICPRCSNPVRFEACSWRCSNTSCRYAEEPFPVVSGVPALVDFEHSVLDADRLSASEGASEVTRSGLNRALGALVHPANTTAAARWRDRPGGASVRARADGGGEGDPPGAA